MNNWPSNTYQPMQSPNILSAIVLDLPEDLFREEFVRRLPSCARGVFRAVCRAFRRAISRCHMLVRVNRAYKFADWCLPEGLNPTAVSLKAGLHASLLEYFGLTERPHEIVLQVALRRGDASNYRSGVPYTAELIAKHCERIPKYHGFVKVSVHVAARRKNSALLEDMSARQHVVIPKSGIFAAGYAVELDYVSRDAVELDYVSRDVVELGRAGAVVDLIVAVDSRDDATRYRIAYVLLTVGRWEIMDAVEAALPGYFEAVDLAQVIREKHRERVLAPWYIREFMARQYIPREEYAELLCATFGLRAAVDYGVTPHDLMIAHVPEADFVECFSGHPCLDDPVDVFVAGWPPAFTRNMLAAGQAINVQSAGVSSASEHILKILERSLRKHPRTRVTEKLIDDARERIRQLGAARPPSLGFRRAARR